MGTTSILTDREKDEFHRELSSIKKSLTLDRLDFRTYKNRAIQLAQRYWRGLSETDRQFFLSFDDEGDNENTLFLHHWSRPQH